jgi:hypothetical protein
MGEVRVSVLRSVRALSFSRLAKVEKRLERSPTAISLRTVAHVQT